jgi:dTDP-4-dehydrorhamnose 3,5-epimerase
LNFVQGNESYSKFGTVRGLHIQKGNMMQAKLVRVIVGKVKDVVIDVRPDSPTFNEKFEIEISANNKKQLFVPKGFLHGFCVLSEQAIFSYKCDNYYSKVSEDVVHPLDQSLKINWGLSTEDFIISDKDNNLANFNAFSLL